MTLEFRIAAVHLSDECWRDDAWNADPVRAAMNKQ
jgi:hypothetical protein